MSAYETAEKLAELESIGERSLGREVALARLRELLGDPEADVRARAAATAAGYPADAGVIAELVRLADDEAQVRAAALGSLGEVLAHGELAGAEEDGYAPDPGLDEPAAADYRRAREVLFAALAEDDAGGAATHALAVLSGEERVVQAIEGLKSADRKLALACMGRSGDARWAEAIEEGLEAGSAEVLGAAIEAAGRVELTSAAPLIARVLKGTRQATSVRVRAAEALARLGGKASGATLLEVAEGDDADEVREAAREALADLTLLGALPVEEE